MGIILPLAEIRYHKQSSPTAAADFTTSINILWSAFHTHVRERTNITHLYAYIASDVWERQ